jgi:hypothetical protein
MVRSFPAGTRISPNEWDNVVLYGQYIFTGSSFTQKRAALSV